jgi:hypothetical protein
MHEVLWVPHLLHSALNCCKLRQKSRETLLLRVRLLQVGNLHGRSQIKDDQWYFIKNHHVQGPLPKVTLESHVRKVRRLVHVATGAAGQSREGRAVAVPEFQWVERPRCLCVHDGGLEREFGKHWFVISRAAPSFFWREICSKSRSLKLRVQLVERLGFTLAVRWGLHECDDA